LLLSARCAKTNKNKKQIKETRPTADADEFRQTWPVLQQPRVLPERPGQDAPQHVGVLPVVALLMQLLRSQQPSLPQQIVPFGQQTGGSKGFVRSWHGEQSCSGRLGSETVARGTRVWLFVVAAVVVVVAQCESLNQLISLFCARTP
jgi:hypothetical protein